MSCCSWQSGHVLTSMHLLVAALVSTNVTSFSTFVSSQQWKIVYNRCSYWLQRTLKCVACVVRRGGSFSLIRFQSCLRGESGKRGGWDFLLPNPGRVKVVDGVIFHIYWCQQIICIKFTEFQPAEASYQGWKKSWLKKNRKNQIFLI